MLQVLVVDLVNSRFLRQVSGRPASAGCALVLGAQLSGSGRAPWWACGRKPGWWCWVIPGQGWTEKKAGGRAREGGFGKRVDPHVFCHKVVF